MDTIDFKSYYSPMTAEAREDFARRCGTSRGHLQNVMSGFRPCADELGALIELESKGVVPVTETCKDTAWVRVPDKSWPHPGGRPLIDPAHSASAGKGKTNPDAERATAANRRRPKHKREDHRPKDKPSSS